MPKRRKADRGILRTELPFTRRPKVNPEAGMTHEEQLRDQQRKELLNPTPRPKTGGLRISL